MRLFNQMLLPWKKKELARVIQRSKAQRPCLHIERFDGRFYYFSFHPHCRIDRLDIKFFGMDPAPSVGDCIYISENIINGQHHLPFYFSTKIGEGCARPPHNFLKEPKEFLIYEYKSGETILLEQWYG